LSQNLLNLGQFKQFWSQNLLSLLVHLHRAPHLILIHHLHHHLHHLQIDHHLQIQLKPHHLLHYHLIVDLQNYLTLDQLEQARLVPELLTHQSDLLLGQDQP